MRNRSLFKDLPTLESLPREVRLHIFSFFSAADTLNTRRVCRLLNNDIYEYYGKQISRLLGGNLYLRYQQEPDVFNEIKRQSHLFNHHVLLITDMEFNHRLYKNNHRPPALLAYHLDNDTYFKSLTPNAAHTTLLYKNVIYSKNDLRKKTLCNRRGSITTTHYKLICVMMDDISIMTDALLDIKHRYLANGLALPIIFISTSSAITKQEIQTVLDLNVNIAGFIPLTPSETPYEHNMLQFDKDLRAYFEKLKTLLALFPIYSTASLPSTSY